VVSKKEEQVAIEERLIRVAERLDSSIIRLEDLVQDLSEVLGSGTEEDETE
jgi:hypothetical protein